MRNEDNNDKKSVIKIFNDRLGKKKACVRGEKRKAYSSNVRCLIICYVWIYF